MPIFYFRKLLEEYMGARNGGGDRPEVRIIFLVY